MNPSASRLYAGETDLARLIEFLPVARPAAWVGDYPGVTDLREMLCQSDLQAKTRLWFDPADRLIAFALVDAFHNLLFDFDPKAASAELDDAILQWGMACLKREPQTDDDEVTLDAVCREENAARMAWLTRYGFQPLAVRTLRFVRSLSEPIPDPQLPAGFAIRPVAGLSEVEALVALHRAAFGTDNMTIEERRAMMSGPDYVPNSIWSPSHRMGAWRVFVSAASPSKRTPSPVAAKATPIPSACIPIFSSRDWRAR